MILDYLRVQAAYAELLDVLQVGAIGAPRRNVLRLAQFGVQVTFREATLPILCRYLLDAKPVIAFVDTAELPYWSEATNHAIVVIGHEHDTIVANDPAYASKAHHIPVGDFELVWLNSDNMCAVIER